MTQPSLTTPRRFSRLPTSDTSVFGAARVYAEALLSATEAAGMSETVLAEFDSFIHDVLDAAPAIEQALTSSFVDQEVKIGVLDKALRGQCSNLFLNFLKVAAEHERLGLLRILHVAAHDLHDTLRNKVRVLVSTATPLGQSEQAQIEQRIRSRLGKEPVLDVQVNPDLIGGIVVRVGDRVFDGSLATQLARVREQLIDRSVYEIQSGRDRFSTAAGN